MIAHGVETTLRRWMAPNFDLIEDLTQEVYVTLCADDSAALRSFRSEHAEALIKYLTVVASSVAIDYLRANSAKKRGDGGVAVSIDALERFAVRQTGSRSSQDHRTLVLDVDRCLRSRREVQPRDRWIFWMYFRHGMTSRAIAEIASLELTQKGVESAIRRLTRQVRECMGLAQKNAEIKNKAEGNGK